MKKLSALAFIFLTSVSCFAIKDTLTDQISFLEAVKKAQQADIIARQAMKEYEKAAQEASIIHKELDRASKAYETATDPKEKEEAMKQMSAATQRLIEAVDEAALAEYRSQKAQEELKRANEEAGRMQRKTKKE